MMSARRLFRPRASSLLGGPSPLWAGACCQPREGARGRGRAPPSLPPSLPPALVGRGFCGRTGGPSAEAPRGKSIRMAGHSVVSFSGVDTCLSSLKHCQSYISTGMEMATKVALDLVENHNDMEEVNEMEKVMLDYAAMSREVSHYVKAVEDTVNQIKRQKPEIIPDLKLEVEEKFKALESTNSDLDLQTNEKVILFKDQLKQMKAQFGIQSDPGQIPELEQVDEDLAVTQSQTNFTCPITQEEMRNPVRNKVCGHTYEEDAILGLIRNKEQRKKKACCPTVGCNNRKVEKSDLVPDEVLKRTIDSQSKHSRSTQ